MRIRFSFYAPHSARRAMLGGAVALGVVLAVSGCASGYSHRDHEGNAARISVRLTNDLSPPADVTVFAVSQDGIRNLLGDVPPNGHKLLHVPRAIFPGTSFRLVAERLNSRAVLSQPITATSTDQIIDWDLETNSMWFPNENP